MSNEEIKHIEFSSEAYMSQTYLQIVRKKGTNKLGIRLSNRKDSGIFNLQEDETIWFQTDSGRVPTQEEITGG